MLALYSAVVVVLEQAVEVLHLMQVLALAQVMLAPVQAVQLLQLLYVLQLPQLLCDFSLFRAQMQSNSRALG